MDLRPSVAAFVRETGVTAWMTSALLHACNLIRRKKRVRSPCIPGWCLTSLRCILSERTPPLFFFLRCRRPRLNFLLPDFAGCGGGGEGVEVLLAWYVCQKHQANRAKVRECEKKECLQWQDTKQNSWVRLLGDVGIYFSQFHQRLMSMSPWDLYTQFASIPVFHCILD